MLSDAPLQAGAERIYTTAALAGAGYAVLALLLSLLQSAPDQLRCWPGCTPWASRPARAVGCSVWTRCPGAARGLGRDARRLGHGAALPLPASTWNVSRWPPRRAAGDRRVAAYRPVVAAPAGGHGAAGVGGGRRAGLVAGRRTSITELRTGGNGDDPDDLAGISLAELEHRAAARRDRPAYGRTP